MKTETKVQHTQEKLFIWNDAFGNPVIRAGGNKIATLSTISDNGAIDRKEEAKANAAFIVTACNNYYPILEALKRVEAFIDAQKLEYESSMVRQIKDAIKAAEQENQ